MTPLSSAETANQEIIHCSDNSIASINHIFFDSLMALHLVLQNLLLHWGVYVLIDTNSLIFVFFLALWALEKQLFLSIYMSDIWQYGHTETKYYDEPEVTS